MSFKEFFRKEKHVALNAQPRNFGIVKYIILAAILVSLYLWKGLKYDAAFIAIIIATGTAVHFFLRWKTQGWTKSWGPYKYIPLDIK